MRQGQYNKKKSNIEGYETEINLRKKIKNKMT